MNCLISILLSCVFGFTYLAQEIRPATSDGAKRAGIIGFEDVPPGDLPGGWPRGTAFRDDKVFHSGTAAARLDRRADSGSDFSAFTAVIPLEFAGQKIELRGFLRLEDVSGSAGLWMREDGESMGLVFDNMQSRQLKGTIPWTEYSIVLPVHPEARKVFFGFLLSGTGKVWGDDLELLVDGKPVADAPKIERPMTALDLDHQFEDGPGITLDKLTPVQVENLVTLGKVWGFLKYYHPQITSGQKHWDYELLRVLPAVLAAPDRSAGNSAILRWIDGLRKVDRCTKCASLDESTLHFGPGLEWISDTTRLGPEISDRLRWIRENRSTEGQFYVGMAPFVGNPVFQHELGHERVKFPDPGFQLLALYRFWNIVEYWSPYRNIIGEDWNQALRKSIAKVALASSKDDYQRALMAVIARLNDGHANLWGSLHVRPPMGECVLPLDVRFLENHAVIAGLSADKSKELNGLRTGDIIDELDGNAVSNLIESWRPYYASSNKAARLRDIARNRITGDGRPLTLKATRIPQTVSRIITTHDLPGPTFRLLSDDVAYLKLSSVKSADLPTYIRQAASTKGLIIDIRNYPSDFVVFTLGSLLVDGPTPFARFTAGDLSNPGAFSWRGDPLSLTPQEPHHRGKLVILVDETSQSQAEYTTMAFRAATGAVVVGSTTAGADGNVSGFALPGGLRSLISGIGVFYPDKRPTQRIGIVPDVQVTPTIAGIRAGRDEVLEAGLRRILGSDVSQQQLEKLAKPAM